VWQFDAVVAQVDCRAAQSKTQSTFPPALTKAQSTFPLDWQHRQDIANCRVGRKKWAFGKKKHAFRKNKRAFQRFWVHSAVGVPERRQRHSG